MSIDRICQAE